jgi:hypothetical protein
MQFNYEHDTGRVYAYHGGARIYLQKVASHKAVWVTYDRDRARTFTPEILNFLPRTLPCPIY